MIGFTLDMEWVPDNVLRFAIDIFDDFNVSATIFATHQTEVGFNHHDVAIHPNFQKDGSKSEIISELLDSYPSSIGARSHGLQISTELRQEMVAQGIKYESNYVMKNVPQIKPFQMPTGTIQFPIFWEDDLWFKHNNSELDCGNLLETPGLKIFAFHPNHIAFNTPSWSFYQKNKDIFYSENPDIETLCYKGYGTRDILTDLLSYIESAQDKIITLNNLYELRWSDTNDI